MERVILDITRPDMNTLRTVFLRRLREEPAWHQVNDDELDRFERYVDPQPPRREATESLRRLLREVAWEFVAQGVIAPGGGGTQNFPYFHRTEFGRWVLEQAEPSPYDRDGYLASLKRRVHHPDPTVEAYLAESLHAYARGGYVASIVMLGVAAERVFDLIVTTVTGSLASERERKALASAVGRTAIKPRLEWIDRKFRALSSTHRADGFPEDAEQAVVALYNMLRKQRNELGHPRERPPDGRREDAYASLQLFLVFYETAEHLRAWFVGRRV